VRVAEPHDLRPSDSPVGAVSCARDAVASGFGRKNHAREKSNVRNAMQGCFDRPALLRKYFASGFRKYVLLSLPSRLDEEGRIAIVTTREAGLRWTRELRKTSASVARTAKSCGPGIPTLMPSCADTIRAAMGAIKPGPQGEHEGHR
jgi:hypothetical protein